MKKLAAYVSRGPKAGTRLTPHRHADGMFVVSPSRFARDYVRVSTEAAAVRHVTDGLSIRMSAPGIAPSLIRPGSLRLE